MTSCPLWMVLSDEARQKWTCRTDGTSWFVSDGTSEIDVDKCQNQCNGIVKEHNNRAVCVTPSPCSSNGLSLTFLIVVVSVIFVLFCLAMMVVLYRVMHIGRGK